jgi:hypothetical protein
MNWRVKASYAWACVGMPLSYVTLLLFAYAGRWYSPYAKGWPWFVFLPLLVSGTLALIYALPKPSAVSRWRRLVLYFVAFVCLFVGMEAVHVVTACASGDCL